MSAGLLALFDDVALLARQAAASIDDVAAQAARTSTKALGVIVDDAAVTPRFVTGVSPKRELPIVGKITVGSLRNKILIILPVALLLSWLAPWALTPILMVGGFYLNYEGAEKIAGAAGLLKHEDNHSPTNLSEKQLVSGAIRTDLILSAEIMVISLNEVMGEPIVSRIAILVVVAIAMTAVVYGAVALLVKIDDIGLRIARRPSHTSKKLGQALVTGMPAVLSAIATIGTAAMLWVGGHIVIKGLSETVWKGPHHLLEQMANKAHDLAVVGPVAGWAVDTAGSLIAGLVVGLIIVGITVAVRALKR